jgi:SnoaL-like domain
MADDRNEIIDVLNLYALAVDSQQWDLFDLVFTSDVVAEYTGGLLYENLEEFKAGFAVIHDPLEGSLHVMTNHQVRIDGDSANSLVYGHYRLIRNLPPGGGDCWEAGGWYDDHLVRTPAGWRIKRRRNRNSWWAGNPFVLAPEPGACASEFRLDTLRSDARNGELDYLKAVRGE